MMVIALAVAYLLIPIDLIPDVTGVGVVDDLALMGLLAWFYRSQVAKLRAAEKSPPQLPARAKSFDPYRVLEVLASATAQAIRTAYRARMNEYHPDKVAHLGQELQDLAHRKSVEIQQAYQQSSGQSKKEAYAQETQTSSPSTTCKPKDNTPGHYSSRSCKRDI